MSANIRGMVFFEQLLEDGEIDSYLGNERLKEDHDEFSHNASQFDTKTINNPKYHDIFDNISNRPSNENPTEEISEGVQDEFQSGVTAVENTVSNPIYETVIPCS